jgi:hypothetical protein
MFLVILSVDHPLEAEDWTTRDGKTYKNVKVVGAEDDAVTILCDDGGARVLLATLPTDLQQKFHYDAVKAKAAAARYLAQQKASDQAVAIDKSEQVVQQQELETKIKQDQVERQNELADQVRHQASDQALAKIAAVAKAGAAHFRCRVIQVIDSKAGHVLLAGSYGVEDYPSANIMIVGLGDQYVDGDWVGCWATPNVWYYAGTCQYTSVAGATMTCRVYSPSLEWAVSNLSNQSK